MSIHFLYIRNWVIGPVNRCRGGEHEFLAVILLHDLHECQRGVQVIPIILKRNSTTLPHCFQSRKVDDGIKGLSRKNISQCGFIRHIDLIKCRSFSGDGFKMIDYALLGIDKVVHNGHIMPRLQ